jgi:glutaredoxin-related protein
MKNQQLKPNKKLIFSKVNNDMWRMNNKKIKKGIKEFQNWMTSPRIL